MSKIGFSDATVSIDNTDVVGITDVSLSVENDIEATSSRSPEQREYSFSAEIEPDTQNVVCPQCDLPNEVPESGLLRLMTYGPINCNLCGYPLL